MTLFVSPQDIARALQPSAPAALGGPDVLIDRESYFGVRSAGRPIASEWYSGVPLRTIVSALRDQHPKADAIEICLGTSRERIAEPKWTTALQNRNRGRFGIEFALGKRVFRIAPTQTIASNRALDREFERFVEALGIDPDQFRARGGTIDLLGFRQFFLQLGPRPSCVELYRGSPLVSGESFSREHIDRMLLAIYGWFAANQDRNGGLVYKYWPSRGEASQADNPIRQFMAVAALAKLAKAFPSDCDRSVAERALAFNLDRFYRVEDDHGLIEWDGSVKLGAVALAGLAILELDAADEHAGILASLLKTIHALSNPDGSFRTFFHPADRNDNQNFYPGETLLFLSRLANERTTTEFDPLIRRSILWYKAFFEAKRNPAFVPWHTQACLEFMKRNPDRDLAAYIFDMNDWLLQMQQWGAPVEPDLWGRFYDPARPDYGPPHASSTGVYLEGLCDALQLASQASESGRADRYRQAIQRGIRSITQLQFRQAADMFYVSKQDRVAGAIRTEAYDNEIRVDNMQHCAAALLKFREQLPASVPVAVKGRVA